MPIVPGALPPACSLCREHRRKDKKHGGRASDPTPTCLVLLMPCQSWCGAGKRLLVSLLFLCRAHDSPDFSKRFLRCFADLLVAGRLGALQPLQRLLQVDGQ